MTIPTNRRHVLVTGATGFVGRHLVTHLRSIGGLDVIGTGRRPAAPDLIDDGVAYLAADLTRPGDVDRLIRETRPDLVAHLAAQPSVAESWKDPAGTLVNNLLAQVNLLESLVRHAPDARVLVVGSSEEYGLVRAEDLPADEDTPLRPDNPYAVSKIAQDYLGLQYFLGRRLAVVRARAFNLFGPGQSDRFALGSFARQIAEAEAGLGSPEILVGNLAVRRDYTDVRDAVRAYWILADRGTPGEVYNVGGGGVRAIGEILDALVAQARRPVIVRVDPDRFRPADALEVSADIRRIRAQFGWEPAIPFDTTIRDILAYWRERIAV
jgi:GDP-4-dehydro-6-deoxy-D-mannose reductase